MSEEVEGGWQISYILQNPSDGNQEAYLSTVKLNGYEPRDLGLENETGRSPFVEFSSDAYHDNPLDPNDERGSYIQSSHALMDKAYEERFEVLVEYELLNETIRDLETAREEINSAEEIPNKTDLDASEVVDRKKLMESLIVEIEQKSS